jgi:hypothetical protein
MRIVLLVAAVVTGTVVALIAESRRNTQVWHTLPDRRT